MNQRERQHRQKQGSQNILVLESIDHDNRIPNLLFTPVRDFGQMTMTSLPDLDVLICKLETRVRFVRGF